MRKEGLQNVNTVWNLKTVTAMKAINKMIWIIYYNECDQ